MQSTQAHACTTYSANRSIPSGFGAVFNVFSSSKELLVRVTCSESVQFTAGGNGMYVFGKAYQWQNGSWRFVQLSGKNKVGDWYLGEAGTTLAKPTNGKGFIAAYVCQQKQGLWKCGCRDSVCTRGYWQLQGYAFPVGTTSTTKPTTPQTTNTQSGNTVSNAPPPKTGFQDITLLSPTAKLPTVAECKARIHRSSWEPREQNNDENYNTTDLLVKDIGSIHSDAQQFYLDRIAAVNSANITGTTDELIQFFSCYWGLDDNDTRARAYIESAWDQDTNGDYDCKGQGVSWGLMQVKNQTPRGCTPSVHTYTYPDVFVSTANNLNYALAWSAACYRGDMHHWVPDEFFSDPEKRVQRCYGLWFSGNWWGGWEDYLARMQRELQDAHWLTREFDSWHDDLCRAKGCDTLPSD